MSVEQMSLASSVHSGSGITPGYMSGFGNGFESEALPGALPVGRNSPQNCPYGLYAEQLSGSPFTAPRVSNERSWLYRIRPTVAHWNTFRPAETGFWQTAPALGADLPIGPLRWDPVAAPAQPVSFVEGVRTMTTAGDAGAQCGMGTHLFFVTRSMRDEYFYNADGELLFVLQEGGLRIATEFGIIDLKPGEVAVIPRGVKIRVELSGGPARGYLCENYGGAFTLPERGPIGANCMANPRDFLTPCAAYEDRDAPSQLFVKWGGKLWCCDIDHSPLDVVAWHGNYAPYKYDLRRYAPVGPILFDHADPSIFTVLTAPSEVPGTANIDFVLFSDRWLVTENTFRPPWYHVNVMSEFMGLIHGVYDAKTGGGFQPGGCSLHNTMLPHGPDGDAFERASNAELRPHKLEGTLAFMFETRFAQKVTPFAAENPALQAGYADYGKALKKYFDPARPDQVERTMTLMTDIDHTHDAALTSWVECANSHADFPIQNLPVGIVSSPGAPPRPATAIGGKVLDLAALRATGLLDGDAARFVEVSEAGTLNAAFALGKGPRRALRSRLSALLSHAGADRSRVEPCLLAADECTPCLPASIGDYTDFYVGIHHATNIGKLFRPDNPLMPNYKWVPIAYHGRASSLRPSGTPVRRPSGQTRAPDAETPGFGPSRRLDYELELGVWIGPGNELGDAIPIDAAASHIAGYCVLNDWSARDIQAWEYQPLGPFLAKNFASTVSPWVVTPEALAPFRAPQQERQAGDPAPLPYLTDDMDAQEGGLRVELEVLLLTDRMRQQGRPSHRVSLSDARHMYWTPAQMIAHHTSGGCNLNPGDLLGTGTISGPTAAAAGALIETTEGGRNPVTLPSGEARTFLEDGDEVIMRARCRREGFVPIGFGECRATILPARRGPDLDAAAVHRIARP